MLLFFTALAAMDRFSCFDSLVDFGYRDYIYNFYAAILAAFALTTPLLLFGKASHSFYRILLALWLPLAALQMYVRCVFSMNLGGDWVGIILASSADEMREFFFARFTPFTTVCVVGFFVLCYLIIHSVRSLEPPMLSRRVVWIASIAIMAAFIVLTRISWGSTFAYLNEFMAFNLIVNTTKEYGVYRDLHNVVKNPVIPPEHGFTLSDKHALKPICVVVIGESATRNRWSLYGYEKPTTPRLDALRDELCVFSSLRATSANTAMAMRTLMTIQSSENPEQTTCTLSQLLAAAGYDCTLLSNQAHWSVWDGLEPFLFADCHSLVFMEDLGLAKPWYDDALLPLFKAELQNARPSFIFLHLMGSHIPVEERYPASFTPFPPEKHVGSWDKDHPSLCSNHYDNSIAFTDQLLAEIIRDLKATGRPCWMLYLSDHGESVSSEGWRDQKDASLWEVPMVWWCSANFKAMKGETVAEFCAKKDDALNTKDILQLLLLLAR